MCAGLAGSEWRVWGPGEPREGGGEGGGAEGHCRAARQGPPRALFGQGCFLPAEKTALRVPEQGESAEGGLSICWLGDPPLWSALASGSLAFHGGGRGQGVQSLAGAGPCFLGWRPGSAEVQALKGKRRGGFSEWVVPLSGGVGGGLVAGELPGSPLVSGSLLCPPPFFWGLFGFCGFPPVLTFAVGQGKPFPEEAPEAPGLGVGQRALGPEQVLGRRRS